MSAGFDAVEAKRTIDEARALMSPPFTGGFVQARDVANRAADQLVLAVAEVTRQQARITTTLAFHVERPWRILDGTDLGGTVCNHCRRDWPCATVRALTPSSTEPESDPRK